MSSRPQITKAMKDAINSPEWPYEWEKPSICRNMPLYDRVIQKMRSNGSLFDHQKVGDLNG